MDFNSYKKVISNCNHIVKVGMVSAYALFLGVNTALASVTEYMEVLRQIWWYFFYCE